MRTIERLRLNHGRKRERSCERQPLDKMPRGSEPVEWANELTFRSLALAATKPSARSRSQLPNSPLAHARSYTACETALADSLFKSVCHESNNPFHESPFSQRIASQ
jgi:hypothetical protein